MSMTNIFGPNETLLRKTDPDAYHNLMVHVFTRIAKEIENQFNGTETILVEFDKEPSRLEQRVIIEKLNEKCWAGNFVKTDNKTVLQISAFDLYA